MRILASLLIILLAGLGATTTRSDTLGELDAIPITLYYERSPVLDACIEGVSKGDAQIGANRVKLLTNSNSSSESAGKKRSVSVRRLAPEGSLSMIDRSSSWRMIRTPFLFKDADHFRRFQTSNIPTRMNASEFIAYGGASHLFSFRTALTEPKHVSGQLIRGNFVRNVYEVLGSKPEPDLHVTLKRLQSLETESIPAEVHAASEEIAVIRKNRNALAALEVPLLDAPSLGLTDIASYVNLTFSTVEPILFDASELLKQAPRKQRMQVERWLRTIALQCSNAVLLAEEAVLQGFYQKKAAVVPVNRIAFAPTGWITSLNRGVQADLDILDAIIDLAWPTTLLRPSKLLSKVDPEIRKNLLEHQARIKETLKREEEERKRFEETQNTGLEELAEAWSELRAELADALEKMPPPEPSGLMTAYLKPQPLPRLTIEAPVVAEALASDLVAILDPFQSCPSAMRDGDACEEGVDAWLNVAMTRSANWSSILPWKSPSRAIERAIALAMPPADAQPRERLRAANQLIKIAEKAAVIDGYIRRRIVDIVAHFDLSSPTTFVQDSSGPRISVMHDVNYIDGWLVRAYRDVGDIGAAVRRIKLARQHASTEFAVRASDGDANPYYFSRASELRNMSLLVGDIKQAWRDQLEFVRGASDFASVWCPYGLKTCTNRVDIRRAMFLTAQSLTLMLLETGASRTKTTWLPLIAEAIKISDGGGLDSELNDFMSQVNEIISSSDDLRDVRIELDKYRAATPEERRIVSCLWKGCPDDWNREDPEPPRVEKETLYYRDSDHPFNIAVKNRDWDKAKSWLEQIAVSNNDGREAAHDALFPAFKDLHRDNILVSYSRFPVILAQEAALAGRIDLVRYALSKYVDIDRDSSDLRGSKIRSLNGLFNVIISTGPR